MKKKTKKIITLLLAFCMTVGTAAIPMQVTAETGTSSKAIQLGASAIKDPVKEMNGESESQYYYLPSSYIYFGLYDNNPIKWRVLDADEDNVGNPRAMFLLSEYVIENVPYDDDNAEWNGSLAQKWCETLLAEGENKAFSTGEASVVRSITKVGEEEVIPYPHYATPEEYKVGSLKGEKLFFPSVSEVLKYIGEYQGAPGTSTKNRKSKNEENIHWWIRSSYINYSRYRPGLYDRNGNIGYDECKYQEALTYHGARPACNIELDTILFTSAAEGGKSTEGMDNGLAAVGDAGTDWKLTLKDSGRNFKASASEKSSTENSEGYKDWKVSVDYKGAVSGANEYVSAMIMDSEGNIIHYGRIAKTGTVNKVKGTEGSTEIAIPEGLEAGEYTLKVFSEQYNGDKNTDYASDFSDIELTVKEKVDPVTPVTPDKPEPGKTPETGDSSNMLPWAVLAGAALATAVGITARRRKA